MLADMPEATMYYYPFPELQENQEPHGWGEEKAELGLLQVERGK
jgi:hypothetical protein